jgi:hypothetical protein
MHSSNFGIESIELSGKSEDLEDNILDVEDGNEQFNEELDEEVEEIVFLLDI